MEYVIIYNTKNDKNHSAHEENIYVANTLTKIFAKSSIYGGHFIAYNYETFKTEIQQGETLHPIHEKLISDFVNFFIFYNNKFENKDEILAPLLYDLNRYISKLPTEEIEVVKVIFKDVQLEVLFDIISQTFFKEKLNLVISSLE